MFSSNLDVGYHHSHLRSFDIRSSKLPSLTYRLLQASERDGERIMGLTGVKARSKLHLTLKLHWLKLVSKFVIEYPRRNDHCKVEYIPNLDTCQRAKMLPLRKFACGHTV